MLGEQDVYLLAEGNHYRLYEKLGAHPTTMDGVEGTAFAVLAPAARRVSVVGNFNSWDGRRHVMRKRHECGVWELFVPAIGRGEVYKYEIIGADGKMLPLKTDPVGFLQEMAPSTGSIVDGLVEHEWKDDAFQAHAAEWQDREKPISIYEVHLGSWRRGDDNAYLDYDEIAAELVPYVKDMGFTHVEFLPVSEHPFYGSWGYQPIGLYAPTSRFGSPEAFARLVDALHQAGIGVLLDWVPGHFPTDVHGLGHFDGTALYEHPDPRRGFHKDWNTLIYDYGRPEVRELPGRQRPVLARLLPHRWPARRCGRLDALPRLFAQPRRMGAQHPWRAREPRGDGLPEGHQRAGRRVLPQGDHARRGVDRLPGRLEADLCRRPRLPLQVEHGLDARHPAVTCRRSRSTGATITTR